jgi:hypothetical protein
VAKEIDAGENDYAIAFQERIRIPGGWRDWIIMLIASLLGLVVQLLLLRFL